MFLQFSIVFYYLQFWSTGIFWSYAQLVGVPKPKENFSDN